MAKSHFITAVAATALSYPQFGHYSPGISLVKQNKSPFKWRHFEPTIILLCVRWYCRYQLSYRDPEEMMCERGLSVDHTTVWRWVQRYAPEINRGMRPHLMMSGTSYRIDETYVKVGTEWKYLYRAVDSDGQTIESMVSTKRDVSATKRFFRKLKRADHGWPRITSGTDKHASYPEAFTTSVEERVLPFDCKLRRVKYLNSVLEQDHRAVRRRWRAARCFRPFHAAERTLEGMESMRTLRKGQVKRLDGRDAVGQAKSVASLSGVAA